MSFLIRALGGYHTGRNSAGSEDTELMAVEEGRPSTSGSLVAGTERPHTAHTYVPGHLDSDGHPTILDGEVETSLTAVEEGQTNPVVDPPAFRAIRWPVEEHPLAQFPILESRPTEYGHKVHGQTDTETSSTIRHRENRNHPYKVGHKHPSSFCSRSEL